MGPQCTVNVEHDVWDAYIKVNASFAFHLMLSCTIIEPVPTKKKWSKHFATSHSPYTKPWRILSMAPELQARVSSMQATPPAFDCHDSPMHGNSSFSNTDINPSLWEISSSVQKTSMGKGCPINTPKNTPVSTSQIMVTILLMYTATLSD